MRQDILKDDNNELLIINGDFVIGPSDQQHVADIFIAQPGEYKFNPTLGFGASSYLKRNITEAEFRRDLKLALSLDGYNDADINLTEGIPKVNITI